MRDDADDDDVVDDDADDTGMTQESNTKSQAKDFPNLV